MSLNPECHHLQYESLEYQPYISDLLKTNKYDLFVDAGAYIGIFTVVKEAPDSFAKNLYKDAEKGLNGFAYKFYGWRCRPGRDDVWFEQKLKEYMSLPDKGRSAMESEYPGTADEALSPMGAMSCFDKEALDRLWENATDPITKQNFIHIFQPPRAGYLYGAGVDVGATGVQDSSKLSINTKANAKIIHLLSNIFLLSLRPASCYPLLAVIIMCLPTKHLNI